MPTRRNSAAGNIQASLWRGGKSLIIFYFILFAVFTVPRGIPARAKAAAIAVDEMPNCLASVRTALRGKCPYSAATESAREREKREKTGGGGESGEMPGACTQAQAGVVACFGSGRNGSN